MVSGVSFKNPNTAARSQKKNRVAKGAVFLVIVLAIVLISYIIGFLLEKQQKNVMSSLDTQIVSAEKEIDGIAKEIGPIIVRLQELDSATNSHIDIDRFFTELQVSAVPGVVLLNLDVEGDEEEGHVLNVTANADNFDVLGGQIKSWKGRPIFDDVSLGIMSRDDNNRIVFETQMNVIVPQAVGAPPEEELNNDQTL